MAVALGQGKRVALHTQPSNTTFKMASTSYAYKPGVSPTPSSRGAGGMRQAKDHGDIFRTTAWRDLWAAVLYYIGLAAFLGIAFVNIKYLGENRSTLHDSEAGKTLTTVLVSALSAILGSVGVSAGLLFAAYKVPEATITFCYVALITLSVLAGIAMIIMGSVVGGIIFLIMAGFDTLLYFLWRSYIPFTAVLLRWTTRTLGEYPAMITANVGIVVTLAVQMIAVFASLSGAALMHSNNVRTDAWTKGTSIYTFFWLFWSEEVLRNVARVTTSGVFACRYFLGYNSPQAPNPTAESFKRATTYSFGSVCFGSLLVAIVTFLRFLLSTSNDRDTLAGAIVDCFLSMLESLLKYFNTYAFTQVAIYGKPYIEAAKSTWELVKRNGVDAIINDNLIGSVIGLGSILTAIVGGLLSLLTFILMNGGRGNYEGPLVAFIIGLLAAGMVSFCALGVISSGVTTFFVCIAEDPAALQRSDPETHQQVASRYSQLNL